jgi:hypothetical protein
MIVAVAFGVVISALHMVAIAEGQTIPPGDYWLFNAVVAVAFSASGAAIAWRRPKNPIGWAFIAGGLGNGLAGIGGQYSLLTGDPIGYWLFSWAWIPLPIAIAVTFLTFPTGHPLTPRWRPVLLAVVLLGGAAMFVRATSPPIDGDPSFYLGPPVVVAWPAWVTVVAPFLFIAVAVTGVASLIARFRRSRGDEHEQLKWLVAASIPLGISFAGGFGDVMVSAAAVLLFAVPVALAILRFRLYDIDLLINRTLVYGALSGSLIALYGGSVLALSAVLHSFTGSSDFAVAGSTLAVVALFQPVRRRIQSAVDRRFYRRKYDAARTLDSFAVRLRDEIDLDALRTELIAAVGATVQPTHASLWLRDTP